MAKLRLSPPWYKFVNEVSLLFKEDEEVHIIYDEENYDLKLYVDNENKAAALAELLPEKKEFGNVTLTIEVVPCNAAHKLTKVVNPELLYETAFNGNPVLSFIHRVSGIFVNDIVYVVFKNKVVQYFNDDLGDVYGQCSTLYQEIAKDLFPAVENVYFCTDKPNANTFYVHC